MIGIDITTERGVVAAFQESKPAVLGEGKAIEQLAALARARLGDASLDAVALLAVPAWYNDEQRKAAGLKHPRLINRPTAVALAYAALHPADRPTVLVLDVEDERFDVAVLSRSDQGFELLGADGCMELNPITASDPAALAGEIESTALRALKQAGIGLEQLGGILGAGRPGRITAIQSRLATALGRPVSTQIRPEHAAALGAAVQAGLITSRGAEPSSTATPTTSAAPAKSPRGGGCLVLLAVLLAALYFLS
jgi:molecular chaperone DnaK (HSP70)